MITRMWWGMVAVSELKERKLETFQLQTKQTVSSKDKLVSEDQKVVWRTHLARMETWDRRL